MGGRRAKGLKPPLHTLAIAILEAFNMPEFERTIKIVITVRSVS